MFEVWLNDRDEVVRISVRPQAPDGTEGAPEQGWTTDYRAAAAATLPRVADAEVTPAAAIDLGQVGPQRNECQLGT